MFCPDYGGKCKGSECRDWNKDKSMCQQVIEAEMRAETNVSSKQLLSYIDAFAESERMNTLRSLASFRALLTLPSLPLESKEFIEQMLQAPSFETAKKLLNELNL